MTDPLEEAKRQLRKLVVTSLAAMDRGQRVDPYLFSMLAYWQRALQMAELGYGEDDDPVKAFAARFAAVRMPLLVGLKKAVVDRAAGGDALAALRGATHFVAPTHLHASVTAGLTVRPCICDWSGLQVIMESLRDGLRGIAAVELSVRQSELGNEQFDAPPVDDPQEQRRQAGDAVAEYRNAWDRRLQARQARNVTRPPHVQRPLVCVVDDLCNFARWSCTNHVPLVGLWHQGSDAYTLRRLSKNYFKPARHLRGSSWPSAGGDLTGDILSGAMVGRRLAIDLRKLPGEAASYRVSGYLHPTPSFSHGSAVLELICGPPHAGQSSPDVLFVQLPVASVLDTGGASLASHALDGIHHALEAAEPGRTVIVNLSYGSHSGPHDGSSLWDQGLKELLDRFDGSAAAEHRTLHVVLPAGNSHRHRIHAHLHVCQTRPRKLLRWVVMPEDNSSSHLELWFPVGARPRITVRSPHGVELRAGGAASMMDRDPRTRAMLLFPKACAQSAHSTMALLTIDSTVDRVSALEIFGGPYTVARPPRVAPPAEYGVWKIEVEQGDDHASRDFQFHAWVARGDAAPNRRQARHGNPGRQSYFLDPDGDTVDPHFTFNGIASLEHDRLWVVGAMQTSDSSLSPYSSAGPNRCSGHPDQVSWRTLGPSVVVPADESRFQPGLITGGVMSGAHLRVSGTSIAAAAFTRHLHDHLASGQPAATVVTRWVNNPSRAAPTGHPFIADADPRVRGERVRMRRN